PFAIGEYSRILLDRGLIKPAAGAWVVEAEALSEEILPRDVIQLVVKRFDALNAETRQIVSAAALIGNRFPVDLLTRATRMRPETIAASLSDAVRATLLEQVDPDSFAFGHDRVREAAMERLNEEQRKDVHQSIAVALDAAKESSP